MPAELRAKGLALLERGELTPEELAKLARRKLELLYDMMEMGYGDDDVAAVDALRGIAAEAAQLILADDGPKNRRR
jgi:hypothetical protein